MREEAARTSGKAGTYYTTSSTTKENTIPIIERVLRQLGEHEEQMDTRCHDKRGTVSTKAMEREIIEIRTLEGGQNLIATGDKELIECGKE